MPTLTIKWHTHPELRQTQPYCDVCDSLDGAEWVFHSDKTAFPSLLTHPKHGIVWDCDADSSRAHGSARFGCYCTLSWVLDGSDLEAEIQAAAERVKEDLRQAVGVVESWAGVSVLVVREQGRFVTWRKT